jgi:hypothetical protein
MGAVLFSLCPMFFSLGRKKVFEFGSHELETHLSFLFLFAVSLSSALSKKAAISHPTWCTVYQLAEEAKAKTKTGNLLFSLSRALKAKKPHCFRPLAHRVLGMDR